MGMSNSEAFLIKGEQERVEFDLLKRPSSSTSGSNDHQGSPTASNDHPELHREAGDGRVEENGGDTTDDNCKTSTSVSSEEMADQKRALGQFNATDHDDEGFTTPTSLRHKIPEIKQCPPAPRKSKSLKRKSSSVSLNVRRSLLPVLAQDANAMFPSPTPGDLHRKIKKTRREGQEY